jgi:adenylosuccinate lyase
MIERYANRKISHIWSKPYRYSLWEDISLKYLNNKLNRNNIYPTASYLEVIEKYEKVSKHEFVAFLTHLHERLEHYNDKEILRNLHYGLTSSDIIDTAFNLQLRYSCSEVNACLNQLQIGLRTVLDRLNDVKSIGRTHGKHAEVINFNSRFKLFEEELRHAKSFLRTSNDHLYGQLTGPVGTSSYVDLNAAQKTLDQLNIKPAPITTQVIPRFYSTTLMYSLTLLASAMERMAIQIRLMAIDEIDELQEGFSVGQAGSSAMPHKKNPISSEKICGLARVVKNNYLTILDNNNLWWERDMSHSSVERIVWPESFHIICHMLTTMTEVMNNLVIKYDNISFNLEDSNADSHKKLLSETTNSTRIAAYAVVQEKYHKYKFTKGT